jgi:hypothetical protein
MSVTPTSKPDHLDGDPEDQVDAMKDQLRKDVASWSAARSGVSVREAAEFSVPVVQVAQQPSPQPPKRVRRAKPVLAEVTPSGEKKPFRMSYDGVTQADYITYMISRGTR